MSAPPQDQQGQGSSASGSSNSNTPAPSTNTSASGASQSGVAQSAADDNLVCKWNSCNQSFQNAEALYDHLCERHVGRKSTNNLNLTCQWNQCRTTTVKRDHITSHIRVHVPLKPYKCEYCGKSFKRPQDLKKHVKTHAEDTVLGSGRTDQNGGQQYRAPPARAPPNSYYDQHGHMRANPAAFTTQAGPASYYGGGAPQTSTNYLFMSAPAQQSFVGGPRNDYMGHNGAPSTGGFTAGQKRGIEQLDEFFGNVKRRQGPGGSYAEISKTLMPLHGVSAIPIHAMNAEYMGSATAATVHAPMPVAPGPTGPTGPSPLAQNYYLPNLSTTRKELENMKEVLNHWETTVYENPAQHGNPVVDVRNSQSPRNSAGSIPVTSEGYPVSAAQAHSPLSAVSSGTPVMTPPSDRLSYTSGNSPSPSASSMSPQSRHSSINYPSLPSMSGVYPNNSVTPTLGPNLDPERTYQPAGVLQRALSSQPRSVPAPVQDTSKSRTHKAGSPTNPRSPSTESDSSESREKDAQYDMWVESMRTISWLKDYVQWRLENKIFEEDKKASPQQKPADAMDIDSPKPQPKTEPSLYPTLRISEK